VSQQASHQARRRLHGAAREIEDALQGRDLAQDAARGASRIHRDLVLPGLLADRRLERERFASARRIAVESQMEPTAALAKGRPASLPSLPSRRGKKV
jgi:hypothetical protein